MSDDDAFAVEADYHFGMVPEWVFEKLKSDPHALTLYTFLSLRIYNTNTGGWKMSRLGIAEELGWSTKTVDRKTKVLVNEGTLRVRTTQQATGEQGWNSYIVIRKQPGGGRLHSRPGRDRGVAQVGTHRSPTPIRKNTNVRTETTTKRPPKTEPYKKNAHPGVCVRCGCWVEAEEGSIARGADSKWAPVHLPGKCATTSAKKNVNVMNGISEQEWTER